MTTPDRPEDARPVVLQEPERQLAPNWNPKSVPSGQPTADNAILPHPDARRIDALHPGWSQVLSPNETPLWHGAPASGARTGGRLLPQAQPLILFGMVGLIAILGISGLDAPLIPLLAVGVFIYIRRRRRATMQGAQLHRRYLLTNRAAYLAREQAGALHDVQAFPITPTMRLGLGPHAVVFTTRRNAKGQEEPDGFLDISDAAVVHAMIRDIQKGTL